MSEPRIVVRPAEVDTLVCEWVTAKILCEESMAGSSAMSAVSIFFPPGKGHARHNHPDAEQLIFVIAGQGEMMIEDEGGLPVTEAIGPGDLVHIPRGAFHSTFNTGWEPIRILAVYSPAGPERYMRASPEFVVVPPNAAPDRE